MKLLKVLTTVLYFTFVLFLSCTDKSTEPQPPDEFEEFKDQIAASPRTDETAELMALFVSGREVAYQTIYDGFRNSLDLVKTQYRSTVP